MLQQIAEAAEDDLSNHSLSGSDSDQDYDKVLKYRIKKEKAKIKQ